MKKGYKTKPVKPTQKIGPQSQTQTKDKDKILHYEGISKRGKKVILIGIGILILGYIILTQTNPEGNNWASILSPTLILLGYATVAIGIIL